MNNLNAFSGLIRRCVDDYHMIQEGDSIAIGVSGGKDSLALLSGLTYLNRYYPAKFTLHAITIDPGFPDMDYGEIEKYCDSLSVPYHRVPTDIREIVFDARQESNPCSLCAKMRKGALMTEAKALGCNKLALGHHFDDAVETFAMSLLYEGRISCFKPVTYMSRSDITQIRPMLYIPEEKCITLAEELQLPVVKNTCPMDIGSKRKDTHDLIDSLAQQFPDLRNRIFYAMQRYPLEGWGREE